MTIRPRYTVRARSLRAGRLDGAGGKWWRWPAALISPARDAMRSRQLQTPHTSLGTAQAAAYNCILIYYRTLIMRSFWSRPSNNGVSFRGKAVESRRMSSFLSVFVTPCRAKQEAAVGGKLYVGKGVSFDITTWNFCNDV